jgi:hypothetical protein
MPSEATAEDRSPTGCGVSDCGDSPPREPITRFPKVVATISDSITLTRMVLQRINGSSSSVAE